MLNRINKVLLAKTLRSLKVGYKPINPLIFKNFNQFSTHKVNQNEIKEPISEGKSYEFKTETHKLLDIVANSLYSEKEVFLRELISNAADATEKFRHLKLVNPDTLQSDFENEVLNIQIGIDTAERTLTIKDHGIGLTEQDLHDNLGTIARSGSKNFLKNLETNNSNNIGDAKDKIIGQFGVGFYSAFMVGSKIEVFTKCQLKESKGLKWTSDGLGSYTIDEVDGLDFGTKIVIHLKDFDYLDEHKIKEVIKKYSNFVSLPIELNGEVVNESKPLWSKNVNEITPEDHKSFFQQLNDSYDEPRYSLVYKTDGPISIRSVLYVPTRGQDMMSMNNEKNSGGISLYSRNVLIKSNAMELLPSWLRFITGVVESEDIPLNLSREMLQNGRLINKLKSTLTSRVIKWLKDEAKRDPIKFLQFYQGYHRYFKEAAILDEHSEYKDDVIELLRFSSSKKDELISLNEYKNNMKEGQDCVFFVTQSKLGLKNSPYFEPYEKENIEVLALADPIDKIVMTTLSQYKNLPLLDIESNLSGQHLDKLLPKSTNKIKSDKLDSTQAENLAEVMLKWVGKSLTVDKILVGNRDTSYPALAVGHEGQNDVYMREVMRQALPPGQVLPQSPVTIEINPNHSIIQGLFKLKDTNSDLAKDITEQIVTNARLTAGLIDDPRHSLIKLNGLIDQLIKVKINQNITEEK